MVYTIRGVWYIPYGNYATVLAPVCHWHTRVCQYHTGSMTVAYKMKVIGGGLKVEGCVPPNVCLLFYKNSNNGLHPYSLRSLSDTSNYDHHFV
ncbi:hypothetical protein EZS27_006616 [termite gut metagenome]|uniref:Uncharacterized protein n=1 Tax=termite gut metagenome TaxID=433724 RepID=A0A5J4SKE1_9ZZZZ